MVISVNSISFGIILYFQLKHIVWEAIPANIGSTWILLDKDEYLIRGMGLGFYPGTKLYRVGESCCIESAFIIEPTMSCRGSRRYRPDQTSCIFDWTWSSS